MAPYFLRNLVPHHHHKGEKQRSLVSVLATLTPVQWLQIFAGWLAWTCDAIDFFSVTLSVTGLQTQFGKSTHDIVSTNIIVAY